MQLDDEDSQKKGISYSSFKIIEELGEGTFGKVFKVTLLNEEKIYAMKVLGKRNLIRNNQLRYAVTECNVLKNASKCPYIVSLHYAFQVTLV